MLYLYIVHGIKAQCLMYVRPLSMLMYVQVRSCDFEPQLLMCNWCSSLDQQTAYCLKNYA
jgi:hypothetical protein